MTIITRRQALVGLGTLGAAGGSGAAIAVASGLPEATALDSAKARYTYHLQEFQKAVQEYDPNVASWDMYDYLDRALEPGTCPLFVSAFRRTGYYEGDGIYEGGRLTVTGKATHYLVTLRPERIDGHRTFSVSTEMDKMCLIEPRLLTFIGRRVA